MATSGGGSSLQHTIKMAVESLKSCLPQPKIDEEADHSNHLIDKFQIVLKQQLQSANEQDSYDSNDITTIGEGHFDLMAKFSKLVDHLNNRWITLQPESNPSLSSPTQLPEHLHQYLICLMLLGDDDAVMTRRQLIYWWVGLGLQGFEDGQGEEDAADDILKVLKESGAIEEVSNIKKQKSTTKYRRIMKLSNQFMEEQKVGILKKEGANLKLIKHHNNGTAIDVDNSKACIETIIMFNPAVSTLNIRRDWLQKMRSLKVLHLGTWSSDKKHMEVETVEFLQALKHLKKVRCISLKGISRIMKLPGEICSLGDSLRVLDLRDCSNLELLPKEIGRLKNLTHLDLSECFLLDRIPKGIVALTKLQVLKGFVITDVETTSSCKFKDLASHLGKSLIKLTVGTRKVSFPTIEDLKAFSQFNGLLKLKLEWVIIHFDHENGLQVDDTFKPKESQQKDTIEPREAPRIQSLKRGLGKSFRTREEYLSIGLPKQLQKLEVQAIPQAAVKSLLLGDKDDELKLKKLHIIGGEVSDLIGQGEAKWKNNIEMLRLKYLTNLHMSWMQFEVSFPNVTHLEMVHCPYLTFFPCDPSGIWTKEVA